MAGKFNYIACAGNGTARFCQALCPAAFATLSSLCNCDDVAEEDEMPDAGDESGTETAPAASMERLDAFEKDMCRQVVSMLVEYQSVCHLHKEVCRLLSIRLLAWDEGEYTVCEIRTMLFSDGYFRSSLRAAPTTLLS